MSSSSTTSKGPPAQGFRMAEVPRFVQYTSPIFEPPNTSSPTVNLPLNLIAVIVSYLDDIGDIARVTRTSRLLYYMTLPQLYQKVSLHSYGNMRYINGRPEGFGGGSPFIMALDGLATKHHVSLVQDFRIWGDWNETGIGDFAKGRIPDNTMMLNILLRTVMDKMTRLHTFSWELTCKPLKTLYQGLAGRNTLTRLTLKFPSSRVLRPSVLVPPMPNLRVFCATDIDPLCYPDDFGLMILQSRKLADIRLHFSPRMRQNAEPIQSLDFLFGRCFNAGYTLPAKHFAMQNYFGSSLLGLPQLLNLDLTKSMTFLDTFGGVRGASANVFIDDTWRQIPREMKSKCRTIRFNEPAPQHVQMLDCEEATLENFYFVNNQTGKGSTYVTPESFVTPETSPSEPNEEVVALGKEYLYYLTHKHGSTLKHLLLCESWTLSQHEIGDIVRLIPNLEQIAVALDGPAFEVFRIVSQFLGNLTAVRLFETDHFRQKRQQHPTEEALMLDIGRELTRINTGKIRYIGAGNSVFRLDGTKHIINMDGSIESIRELTPLRKEDVQHVAIWAMDNLDIMTDPFPIG